MRGIKELYIYGAGGHAKVVASAAELCGYTICGFFEDGTAHVGETIWGIPIVSAEDISEGASLFISFGDNAIRLQKGLELESKYSFPSIIHPSAQVSKYATIGKGVFIGAMANIDPSCWIGDFCIINNHASISHDSFIDRGTHVSVNVSLAGHVRIGQCCCLGIGCTAKDEVTIGAYSTIGAGAVVVRDIPANVTAVGCPAKTIKTNK